MSPPRWRGCAAPTWCTTTAGRAPRNPGGNCRRPQPEIDDALCRSREGLLMSGTESVAESPMRSSPLTILRRAGSAWSAMAPLYGASRLGVAGLAGASVLAGIAEAALLTLIAAIGQALSVGSSHVVTHLGPVTVR